MKRIAIALSLVLTAAQASAISRYDIGNMSCSKVQATIQSEGAAILRYRSPRTGTTLHNRFVSNRRYCGSGEAAIRASVPTSDRASCPVSKCVLSAELNGR
jgi:hypothetical protein